jgi:hypothetical protein
MILDAKKCSNCNKIVPDNCDGVVYDMADSEIGILVCVGRHGESIRAKGGKKVYHFVMGYGTEWDVELPPEKILPN